MVVPMPTLPLPLTVRSVALVVEATVKIGSAPAACWFPSTDNWENGEVVPMPM